MSETQTGMSKQTNEERRAERLRREIQKQHGWRVKTWAVAMKYIDERQKELAALGFDEEELFQPDFNNPAMVEEYASGLIPT